MSGPNATVPGDRDLMSLFSPLNATSITPPTHRAGATSSPNEGDVRFGAGVAHDAHECS